MSELIMDSGNLAEALDMRLDDEGEDLSDLTGTKSADPETMDFHVQMRGYTMRDFEQMVVHAAAHQLVGGRTFKSEIEAKVSEIANSKLNSKLSDVMKDVMTMTVIKRGSENITLGQMIGMEAKDYLTQKVGGDGKPSDGWSSRDAKPRVEWLVQKFVQDHFAKEIKAAMDSMMSEIRGQMKLQLDQIIQAERARLLASLGHEVNAKR